MKPSTGSITVDTEPVTKSTAQQIAYLPHDDSYYSYYTVKEMINLYSAMFKDFSRGRASEISEILEIPNQKINQFSKGFKSRVKILLCLSRMTPYILMDEPFIGLDTQTRKNVIHIMLRFVDLTKQSSLLPHMM